MTAKPKARKPQDAMRYCQLRVFCPEGTKATRYIYPVPNELIADYPHLQDLTLWDGARACDACGADAEELLRDAGILVSTERKWDPSTDPVDIEPTIPTTRGPFILNKRGKINLTASVLQIISRDPGKYDLELLREYICEQAKWANNPKNRRRIQISVNSLGRRGLVYRNPDGSYGATEVTS
jgi:hypothetical protein